MLYPIFAVLFLSAVQGGKLYYNRYDDLCSNSIAACPDGTCCLIAPNKYACCIYKNAECCSDKTHCCPEGYACDVKNGQCIKDGIKISWQNASLTTKEHKPTNDVGFVNKLNFFDRVFSHERTLKTTPKCQSNHTVCLLDNDDFGCCPYPNAICCSGGEGLCCPNDHTCNVNSKKCEKSATKVTRAEDPLPKHLSDQICPDAQTSCTSNMTCCPLADGEYGCCPFHDAVCCADYMHCCPQNFICDLNEKRCVKRGYLLLMSPLKTAKQAKAGATS